MDTKMNQMDVDKAIVLSDLYNNALKNQLQFINMWMIFFFLSSKRIEIYSRNMKVTAFVVYTCINIHI